VPTSSENQRGNAEKNYNHVLLIKKMFIIYLSLVLMETKCYLRKQNLIKEEIKKKKNLESRIKNAEAFGYFGSKRN
jgi:glycopeptide antibiotics resistance protein